MWKNERRSVVIKNIILFLMICAIAAGLWYAMLVVRAGNREYDTELSKASKQQQQQLIDNKQQQIADIQAEYDQDLAVISKYLPGIVCWGDGLTAGSYGNVAYPDVLQSYIDTNICSVYDFFKTLDASTAVNIDTSVEYKVSIPVVNMGSGTDNSGTVLGRSGAAPFVTEGKLVIPAAADKVSITFTNADGKDANPLNGGDVGMNEVTISGIKGKISLDGKKYYFTRSEAGSETEIPEGTQIITNAADMYKDYIHVVWIGTYQGFSDADDLINQIKTLLARQTSNTDRYIVIGLGSYKGVWDANVDNMDNLDTAMTQAFGSRFINLRKYLCSDGLSDAGVTATNVDVRMVRLGHVPESLRSASGSLDFSAKAYNLIGKLVYERMNKLGYFDEIREELKIK